MAAVAAVAQTTTTPQQQLFANWVMQAELLQLHAAACVARSACYCTPRHSDTVPADAPAPRQPSQGLGPGLVLCLTCVSQMKRFFQVENTLCFQNVFKYDVIYHHILLWDIPCIYLFGYIPFYFTCYVPYVCFRALISVILYSI